MNAAIKTTIKKYKEKYTLLPLPVKASLFFVFCGAFRDVIDALCTPIFTRILTTEEYGLYGVYNSWFSILRLVVTVCIYSDSFNVGLAKFKEDSERYTSSLLGLVITLTTIWAGLFFIFQDIWNRFSGLPSVLMSFMILQILFSTSYLIWCHRKRYGYEYKILTLITIIYILLQPSTSLLFIKLNTYGLNNGEVRIYAAVGIEIIIGLILMIKQFTKNRSFFFKKYWKYALRLNIPLIPYYLSQVLLNQSDKIMINAFDGKTNTAIYSVAHSAAFVIAAITTNLNSTLIPWLYERLKSNNFKGIKKAINSLLIISSALVTMLVLVAPEFLRLFAGQAYYDGRWIIPALAFSVYLIFVYTQFSNVELYYEKTGYIIIPSIVGSLVNIILNIVFIKEFGYFAAGYTTIVGYLVMCIGHIFFTKLICKKKQIPFSAIYDIKAILIITVALFVLCAMIMFIYDIIVVRYALLMIGFFVLVMVRKSIIRFISGLKVKNK